MSYWAVLLLGLALLAPIGAAAQTTVQHAGSGHRSMETLKERLSDKASDEQRVNDCKVPPEKRSRARPTDCGDAAMSVTQAKH
jgi:hypothetical protein